MSDESELNILQEYALEKDNNNILSMFFKCKADAALHLLDVDSGTADVTGYTPEELLATGMMTLMDLVASESRNTLRYNIQQGIGEGKAFASWFIMRRKDSSTTRAFIQGKGNVSKQLQLISLEGYIAADISKNEQVCTGAPVMDAMTPPPIQAADPGYVHLLNYSTEILGLVNRLDEIEYITPTLRELSNMAPGNHQLFASIFSPDSAAHIEDALKEIHQSGEKIGPLQVYIENKEGIPTIVDLSLSPAGPHSSAILFRIEIPRSSHSLETKKEISSDPQAKELEIYQQAFVSNAMGMAIAEQNTNIIIDINNQFLSLFECSDRNEVINNNILDLELFDQADITRINDVTEVSGAARPHQIEIKTQQKNARQVLASAQSLHLTDGTYTVYFFDANSVVQKMESDENSSEQVPGDLKISEELTTLLSLMKMIANKSDRNDYIKCEGLLTSVLYLHDPTCQDVDGERITMDAYLGKITKSYLENYNNSDIEYEFICDHGLLFDRTLAQAFGMVTVELISNSLHHAFEQGKKGKITVSMNRDQTQGTYLLSIADTGTGIPDIDTIEESGISMVRNIAKSLRGTIEFAPTNRGAHVKMTVPIPVLI